MVLVVVGVISHKRSWAIASVMPSVASISLLGFFASTITASVSSSATLARRAATAPLSTMTSPVAAIMLSLTLFAGKHSFGGEKVFASQDSVSLGDISGVDGLRAGGGEFSFHYLFGSGESVVFAF